MSLHRLALKGWPANVGAFYVSRSAGVSAVPYSSMNLALHVGDASRAVRENRRRVLAGLGEDVQIAWLSQVHGTRVCAAEQCLDTPPEADGCWTATPGLACAVLTADCLPVLMATRDGARVAAVHAGWRGLADGILESALAALQVPSQELLVWLGPAIGVQAFEVGPEVRERFMEYDRASAETHFYTSSTHAQRFLADLPGLAESRLRALGVADVVRAGDCTYRDADRCFSHRRDGVTGRNGSLIVRYPQA